MEEGGREGSLETERRAAGAEAVRGNPGDAGTGAGFGDLRGAERWGGVASVWTTPRGDFQNRTLRRVVGQAWGGETRCRKPKQKPFKSTLNRVAGP